MITMLMVGQKILKNEKKKKKRVVIREIIALGS